jgi:PAS domain S-box-containing protein
LAIRLIIAPVMGDKAPYITFFPAVMLAAWFGGAGPGALAAVLSLLAADYFVIPPLHSLRLTTLAGQLAAFAFLIVSAFIVMLSEALRRSRAHTEARVQQLALEHFHFVLDAVKDYALLMLDSRGRVITWNQGAHRMKGFEAGDILGRHFSCFYLPDDVEKGHPDKELQIAADQGHYSEEGWRMRKDGSRFLAHVVIASIRDSSGKLRGFTKVTRDLTERETIDKKLREQALILDLANDAIFIRDGDDRIIYWNQGAQRLYGWNKEEALGQVTHTLLKTQFPESLAAIQAQLQAQGHWQGELVHARRDGSLLTVASSWTVQRDASNQPTATLEVSYDITARKEAERQAAERAAELRAVNKELEDFAYVASHDLKAPLRVIDNASKWLEEDLAEHLTDETRAHMDMLRGRVKRMEKLLDDLLEYARIGRQMDERYAERVAGDVLMDNILGLLSPEGFTVKVSPNFSGIYVARMPLQQILMNLVGNAVKHHDKKEGSIEVTVEDCGAYYAFAVKDDGPGIPARFHDQVFQMFQTLRPRDQVEGSGMGLALVRKNIEVFGGALELESGAGRGSIFRFTWPKQQRMKREAA